MKKRVLVIITGSLITLGLISGCNHHSTPTEKLSYVVEEINDELDLSATQLVKLNKLKVHLLSLHKAHKAENKQSHEQFRAMLDKPYLDQQAILSHVTAKTVFVNEKAPEVVALLAGFYDSLNDNQRKEVREKLDKHHKRHKRWHGED